MRILELKSLLDKYREQKITVDEKLLLADLLSGNKYDEDINHIILEDLEKYEPNGPHSYTPDYTRIYRNIESQIKDFESFNRKRSFWASSGRFLKIAAVFILVFVAGGTLSHYVFSSPQKEYPIAYNEIKAPFGAKSEIELPDGSKVWLNAGSKIRYQNAFNKVNRHIYLEGEAYFKVSKNEELPFKVNTAELSIIAIGTEFNVKAYADEGIVETTLVEGKITIKHDQKALKKTETIYLEPHQKAVFIKENQQLSVEDLKTVKQIKPRIAKVRKGEIIVAEKIDPEPIVSWTENRLILKGEELSNLLIKLERKYDVKFIYESENIKQFRFSGTLEDETITQVLDVIKLSAPIDYRLEGKTVEIFENKQMSRRFSGHLKKSKP